MRHLALAPLTVLGWLAAGSFSPAVACSCASIGPVCQAFWSNYAVLDATVLEIEEVQWDEWIGDRVITGLKKLVTLDVHKAWKGAAPGRLQITTRMDSAACGFDFRIGGRYLVFGRSRPGRLLEVSICSPTRAFERTGEAAEFLASLDLPPRGGRIFGSVRRPPDRHGRQPRQPIPVETTVRLLGGGQIVTQRSVGGRIEFTGLESGGYEVVADAPAGYQASRHSLHVVNTRACAQADIWIRDTGRISGRAVNASGVGVPRLAIDLTLEGTSLDAPFPNVQTVWADEHGSFELSELAAGRYILGVNLRDQASEFQPYSRLLYSSTGFEPDVIELGLGESKDIGQWKVPPPLQQVVLSGLVTWRDGFPAAGVQVDLRDVSNGLAFGHRLGAVTDGAGRFAVSVLATRTYRIHLSPAGRAGQFPVASPVLVTANTGLQPVHIAIQADRQGR